MKKAILILALAVPSAVHAQTDLPDSDPSRGYLYAGSCTGSTATGTVMSVAIPTGVSVTRRVYAGKVTIISTANTTLTIRIRAATNPSSTITQPAGLNTTIASGAKTYCESNVGSGTLVATWPLIANVPYTYDMEGVMFASGLSGARNLNFHIAAVSGTYYATSKWRER
jgi:hypothetical protein